MESLLQAIVLPGALGAAAVVASSAMPIATDYIKTHDGVELRYAQFGAKSATAEELLFVPGWMQTAAQFQKQVAHFQKEFHVTVYDHRGHGDSQKPSHGYHIYRLATDLEELMTQLDLRNVTLVAHNMGNSVVWAYFDLFAHRGRVARYVLVDEPAALTRNPVWTVEQNTNYGAMFDAGAGYVIANKLSGTSGIAGLEEIVRSFFSPEMDKVDFKWHMQQMIKMPLDLAAKLLLDHLAADWRDVIARIRVPVLVVGATGSHKPVSAMEWIARQIPGARLEIFGEDDGGSHFMFWENPTKFNSVVEEFMRREKVTVRRRSRVSSSASRPRSFYNGY